MATTKERLRELAGLNPIQKEATNKVKAAIAAGYLNGNEVTIKYYIGGDIHEGKFIGLDEEETFSVMEGLQPDTVKWEDVIDIIP